MGFGFSLRAARFENRQFLAGDYQISSIPTLMVFKGGRVVEQILGGRPKPAMAQLIEKHL